MSGRKSGERIVGKLLSKKIFMKRYVLSVRIKFATRKTESERNFKRRSPLNARNSLSKNRREKILMGYKIKENR